MPIRYVTAAVLASAIIAASFAGLDNVSTTNSQNEMDREITKIEDAAVSLLEDEELAPPGQDGPRRVLTLTFPDGSLGFESLRYFSISRIDEGESRIEYQLESGVTHQRVVRAPIVDDTGGTFELNGPGNEVEIVLTLEPNSDGEPIVHVGIA